MRLIDILLQKPEIKKKREQQLNITERELLRRMVLACLVEYAREDAR